MTKKLMARAPEQFAEDYKDILCVAKCLVVILYISLSAVDQIHQRWFRNTSRIFVVPTRI